MSKDWRRYSDKNLGFCFGYLTIWELWSKRLKKAHFLFCTSLYLKIILFCHCVSWFLWNFEKRNSKNIKFLSAEFLEFSLKMFLNTKKYHNLLNFLVKFLFIYHWNPLEKLEKLNSSTPYLASSLTNNWLKKKLYGKKSRMA